MQDYDSFRWWVYTSSSYICRVLKDGLCWHWHCHSTDIRLLFYHATFMLWQHLILCHYLDAERHDCIVISFHNLLRFSRFSPSLWYVKLKKALNMKALLKCWMFQTFPGWTVRICWSIPKYRDASQNLGT